MPARVVRTRFGWAVGAGLALAFALAALPARVPRECGPLRHEAYVWQRDWTPAVRAAVREAGPRLAGWVALAAEVQWRRGRLEIVRVELDPALVAGAGIALRIGSYPGPFADDDEVARRLGDLAHTLARELRPRELQIDFDCAEAKLEGYRRWVRAIRRRVPSVPVSITALPCWLDRPAFSALAAEAGGFVLQVHALGRPEAGGAPILCDSAAARRAVERAARAGIPFRVALPTYGCRAGWAADGRLLGVASEGPDLAWPADANVYDVRADADALADLVRGWCADRPAAMTGLIWYRLPVSGERHNWRWPTLASVLAGRPPERSLRAVARRPAPGLVEIDLVNEGEADETGPVAVLVRPGTGHVAAAPTDGPMRPIAGDALRGFEWSDASPQSVLLRAPPGFLLPPGERVQVGWIRWSHDGEVDVDARTSSP